MVINKNILFAINNIFYASKVRKCEHIKKSVEYILAGRDLLQQQQGHRIYFDMQQFKQFTPLAFFSRIKSKHFAGGTCTTI